MLAIREYIGLGNTSQSLAASDPGKYLSYSCGVYGNRSGLGRWVRDRPGMNLTSIESSLGFQGQIDLEGRKRVRHCCKAVPTNRKISATSDCWNIYTGMDPRIDKCPFRTLTDLSAA